MKTTLIWLSLLVMTPGLAEECQSWRPEFQEKPELIIGQINIETQQIFDLQNKKESAGIHRLANRIHSKTKKKVVERQLLFRSSEPFEMRKLNESVRLLRANSYIKDAQIEPIELCANHKVNISVTTRDKWTLSPGISIGRSGGKNKSGFEIEENNIFGLGKSLIVSYEKSAEREERYISHFDPQFFGSRNQLRLSYQDNSDGKGHEVDFSLPFYEFDSRRSWKLNTSKISQQSSLYDQGEVTEKIQSEKQSHTVAYGWSNGLVGDHTKRFKVGWNYASDDYKKFPNTIESYPWIAFEFREENYITKTNFKTMGQIEDVSLGRNFQFEIGWLNKNYGSTEAHLKFATNFSRGIQKGQSLGFINLGLDTYLGDGSLKGETLDLQGEWYTFNKNGNDLYFRLKLKNNSSLRPDEQISLGDETGLRGYPKGYQNGDKSILFNAEKRLHFDWYPLDIAKFGAVAFLDAGTAWGRGNDANILANIGVGLRIVPTRSSKVKALHLDLAIPLTDTDNVDDVQFSLKTSQSF